MRYLLVDGHSVIFAWPGLRKLHDRRTATARGDLINRLTAYQDATGVRVVVVFDGKGEKSNEESAPGGIQIFYSAAGQSADAIIERLVAKYGREHDLTVATDDHMEQQTVTTFGAGTVSTGDLRALLDEASADVTRQLRSLRKG